MENKPFWIKVGQLAIPISIVVIPLKIFIFYDITESIYYAILYIAPESFFVVLALAFGMKNKPYWIKGGLLAIPISIVVIPLSIFICLLFGEHLIERSILLIAPESFFLQMALLSGLGAPPNNIVISLITIAILIFAILIFVLRVFIMGAVIGVIYGIFERKNKRKFFFTGLIVIFLTILGLLFYISQDPSSVYNSVNSTNECASILKKGIISFDENRCYKELAIKKQDASICYNLKSPYSFYDSDYFDLKVSCYEDVAFLKNDPAICELILDEAPNYNEKSSCYYRMALNTNDPAICELQIDPSWKSYCYLQMARHTNDPAICELVEDEDYRYRCYEDLYICDKIPSDYSANRDYCYSSKAREEQNPTLCEQIKDVGKKEKCFYYTR